jgi:hypothetical protein
MGRARIRKGTRKQMTAMVIVGLVLRAFSPKQDIRPTRSKKRWSRGVVMKNITKG